MVNHFCSPNIATMFTQRCKGKGNIDKHLTPKKKRIHLTCEYFNLSTKCIRHCGEQNGDKTNLQVISFIEGFRKYMSSFERYEGKDYKIPEEPSHLLLSLKL